MFQCALGALVHVIDAHIWTMAAICLSLHKLIPRPRHHFMPSKPRMTVTSHHTSSMLRWWIKTRACRFRQNQTRCWLIGHMTEVFDDSRWAHCIVIDQRSVKSLLIRDFKVRLVQFDIDKDSLIIFACLRLVSFSQETTFFELEACVRFFWVKTGSCDSQWVHWKRWLRLVVSFPLGGVGIMCWEYRC